MPLWTLRTLKLLSYGVVLLGGMLLLTSCNGELKKLVQSSGKGGYGVASVIVVQSGDNQTGSAGSNLANAIAVSVQDNLGNPIPNIPLTWSGGVFGATTTTTDVNGNSSNSLQLATSTGTETITVAASSIGAQATVTAQVLPATLGGLQLAQVPLTTLTGATFPVQVTAQDIYQNTKTDFTGTVHFTSTDASSPSLPADYSFSSADQGVHTFNISLNTVGTQTITVSVNQTTPLVQVVSSNISVQSSVAVASLAMVTNPVDTVAGQSITSFSVQALDSSGNTVTGYNGNILVSLANNPLSGVLAGTTVQACVNGVATFNDLKINSVGTGYTLQFSANGVPSVTSTSFNILAAAPASITTLAGSNQTGTAGQLLGIPLSVVVKDTYGNLVPAAQVNWNSSAGTLSNTIVNTDTSGQSQVSFTLGTIAGTETVTATVNGTTLSTPFTETSQAGSVVASLAWVSSPLTTYTASNTVPMTSFNAKLLDAYGNTVTSGSTAFNLTLSTGTGTLGGTTTKSSVAGFVSFSDIVYSKAETIVLQIANGGSTLSLSSNQIVVSPGAVSSTTSTIAAAGNNVSADGSTSVAINITLKDAYGNAVPGLASTFTATGSGNNLTQPSGTSNSSGLISGSMTSSAAGAKVLSISSPSGLSSDTATVQFISTTAVAANSTISGTTPVVADGVATSTVSIVLRDISSNPVANLTPTISATGSHNSYSSCSMTDAGGNSTCTFSSTTAETKTLSLTSPVSKVGNSIVFTPGSTTNLSISGVAGPLVAGAATTVTVTALDANGNVTPSYTGTITFSSSDSAAVLPSSYTFVSGDNGVHVFTGGVTLKTAGTQSVTVSNGSGITATQSGISVTVGAIHGLTLSQFPTTVTAGSSNALLVTAVDSYQNTITNYTGTVHFSSTNTGASLPGSYTFLASDNGAHTFSSVVMTSAGTGFSLTAADTVTASINGSETGIAVLAASADHLAVVAGNNLSGTVGSVLSTALQAEVLDVYNNPVANYVLSFTPTAGSMATATATTGANGTASDALTLPTTSESVTVAVAPATGTLPGTPGTLNFSETAASGAAVALMVSGFTSPITAGTAGTVTVKAVDSYGNVAPLYTGSVSVTSSDSSAVLPATHTFTTGTGQDNGVHSFSVTLNTSGSQSIIATDTVTSSITGAQTGIVVNAGTATHFLVSGFPTSINAGSSGSVTVTARDANNNTVTTYVGTVHFTSTDAYPATLPSNYTFVSGDNGAHTFTSGVTFKTAGTQTLTATDTVTTSISGTESGIQVSPLGVASLTLTGLPNPIVAGTAESVTLTALDPYGNHATSYAGTVHFTSTDAYPAALPANYTFTGGDAGQHVFTNGVTFKTVGSQSVTATDTVTGSLTATDGSVTVNSGSAVGFTVAGFPSPQTAGTLGSMTVTALDSYGNTATGYVGTVHFSSTDVNAAVSLPANYTFVVGDHGVHVFTNSVKLVTAGSQTVTVQDTVTSSITGYQAGITINAAAVSQLAITTEPSVSYPSLAPITVVFKEEDTYGNVVTTAADTVSVSITTDPSNGATLGGTNSQSAVNGVASFNNLTVNLVGSGFVLTGSVTPVSTAYTIASSSFNITAGAAAGLVFFQNPSSAQLNTAISPAISVQVIDASGNKVSTSESIQLALGANPGGAGTPAGTLTQTTNGSGLATFSDIAIDATGVGYTLVASCSGLSSVTSNTFSISAQSINLQQTIDFLDFTIQNGTSSAEISPFAGFTLDTSLYTGATYSVEVVASNTDTSAHTIYLVDSSKNNVGSGISVPASTPKATRLTYSISPVGAQTYFISVPGVSSGSVTLYSARILINQTSASSTAAYIPLYNGGTTTSNYLDQNSSTSWSQGTPNRYTSWTYNAANFSTVTNFVFSGTLQALITGQNLSVNMGLWDVTAGAIVSGSTCSNASPAAMDCEITIPASSLINGHVYQAMTKTSSANQTLQIGRAGIFVVMQNLTHSQTYYRNMRNTVAVSSAVNNNGRQTFLYNSSLFPTSTLVFSCQATTSTGSAVVSMLENPTGNVGPGSAGTSTPLVTGSGLTVSTGSAAVQTTSNLVGNTNLSSGQYYIPFVSAASANMTVTNCFGIVSF